MRILVVVALTAFLLLVFSVAYSASSRFHLAAESVHPVICIPDEETKTKMRVIMLAALDVALNDQIEHLFETWMKDSTGQPHRARAGVDRVVAAYLHAQTAVKSWNPPVCATMPR